MKMWVTLNTRKTIPLFELLCDNDHCKTLRFNNQTIVNKIDDINKLV
jgi:hypothetical protein